jgi:hypothetical protein
MPRNGLGDFAFSSSIRVTLLLLRSSFSPRLLWVLKHHAGQGVLPRFDTREARLSAFSNPLHLVHCVENSASHR